MDRHSTCGHIILGHQTYGQMTSGHKKWKLLCLNYILSKTFHAQSKLRISSCLPEERDYIHFNRNLNQNVVANFMYTSGILKVLAMSYTAETGDLIVWLGMFREYITHDEKSWMVNCSGFIVSFKPRNNRPSLRSRDFFKIKNLSEFLFGHTLVIP